MLVAGLFVDTESAGKAVGDLKAKGYTDHVSVIVKEAGGEVKTHTVKDAAADGTLTGVIAGGAVGTLAGLIAGAATVAVPGATLLVGGPLAVSWGVTGAAAGALSGGLLGALVDVGFPEEKAKLFEEHILRGEALVAVSGNDDRVDAMISILKSHGAIEIESFPQAA